jgi:hypothetical protein
MKHLSNKTSLWLLTVNGLFWLVVATGYLFVHPDNYLIIKVLLFLEALACFVGLYGLLSKKRVLVIFVTLQAGANTLLSLTDELGLWDITAFLLSLALLVSLIRYLRSTQKTMA